MLPNSEDIVRAQINIHTADACLERYEGEDFFCVQIALVMLPKSEAHA